MQLQLQQKFSTIFLKLLDAKTLQEQIKDEQSKSKIGFSVTKTTLSALLIGEKQIRTIDMLIGNISRLIKEVKTISMMEMAFLGSLSQEKKMNLLNGLIDNIKEEGMPTELLKHVQNGKKIKFFKDRIGSSIINQIVNFYPDLDIRELEEKANIHGHVDITIDDYLKVICLWA